MNIASRRDSITFPHGFLDFLRVSQGRRRSAGNCELKPERLDVFNRALHQLSPEAPSMTLDQMATAAKRALTRHATGGVPPFIASRMAALERLKDLVNDAAWDAGDDVRRPVAVLEAYRGNPDSLIPDNEPVIGLLDEAVLVDVALQLLRDELSDYEDFCRFRRVAAEFAGMPEGDLGLTRAHWLEAMLQAHDSRTRVDAKPPQRYVPDVRASLFHIT